MSDLKKKHERGQRAAVLLNNETLIEAFTALEARYTSDWKNSKVDEVDKRNQSYANLTALEDLKTQLRLFVDDGKIASKQMQKSQN
jgi:predicted phosphoribosyltransferase